MNPITSAVVNTVVSAPAARVRVPRQLPAVTHRVWVDRTRELAALESLHARPGPHRVVLTGMPGVGKTALALRWLLAQRPACPDGELYADLSDTRPGTPDQPAPGLEQVLAGWVRALGVHAHDIPHDRRELAALFRTLAADLALLILIDNARSAAQVRPLLPASPRTAVLVTSRHWLPELAMDGCEHLHLQSLSGADGAALLAGVLPSHHRAATAALTAVAGHCCGLPRALVIAGGYLTLRPSHTPAELAARLDTHPGLVLGISLGEQTVGAVLDMMHRDLAPDLTELLWLCAIHPGREFTAPPLAAAWIRTADDTEQALAQLRDAHLLIETGPNRYRLDDLVSEHTRAHGEHDVAPEERDAAVRRMIQWYLRRAAHADWTLNPRAPRITPVFADTKANTTSGPFPTTQDALRWCATERATLIAAQHRAANLGWHALAAELGEAMWNPLRLAGTAADLLETQRRGAAAAAQCSNPVLEALCLVRAAYAETNLGHPDQAVATATTALERAEQAEHRWVQGAALETRARARLAADDPHTALEDLTRSLVLTKALDHPTRGIALRERLYGRILAHPEIADLAGAIEHFRNAADLAVTAGDAILHARVVVNLATALARSDQAPSALRELDLVEPVLREYGSFSYLVEWEAAAGDTHAGLGDPAAAGDHYRAALSRLESAGRGETRQHTEISTRLHALFPAAPTRAKSRSGPDRTTEDGAADEVADEVADGVADRP